MNVALWAEIRRLHEIEKLSGRTIARRLHCSRDTLANALTHETAPPGNRRESSSILDPYLTKIDALVARYPELSAVRIREEIAKPPEGYGGSLTLIRRYLRKIRPVRGRVYQEVHYEPAQAVQVDWGECGQVQVGCTTRKVSVFVAVLCYSRLLFIEFTLSQRKAEFYRALVHALMFFGGSPRALIFDNLKAAVLNGSGRTACFHPDFLALCGHFCLQPIACQRRDPESKGVVEGGVRYVKHNALAGRAEELVTFEVEHRRRSGPTSLEQQFDALGPAARQFHLQLQSRPVKTSVHLRRLLGLAQLYGRAELLFAISRALELATCDAAYVENILMAQRRQRKLPTPTLPAPKRRELIDEIELEPADPAVYDRFCQDPEEDSHGAS